MTKKKYKRPKRFDLLTEKQIYVMRLRGMGYSNKEIAAKMCVSVKAIEFHRSKAIGTLCIPPEAYSKLAFKVAAKLI